MPTRFAPRALAAATAAIALAVAGSDTSPAQEANPAPPPAAPAAGGGVGNANPPASEVIHLGHCAIEYERISQVGTASAYGASILTTCNVRPGQHVKAGDPLGKLADEDLAAAAEIKKINAESLIDIEIAKNELEQAQSKLKRSAILVKKNSMSAQDYDLDRLAAEAAKLKLENAKKLHDVAIQEHKAAQAQLGYKVFRAPYDGVILNVLKRQGDVVQYFEPVYQIADTSLLRIIGNIDATDLWRIKEGHPVRVSLDIGGADLPVERQVLSGRISFVDRIVDPLTQTCKVWAEVDNKDETFRAGLEARMEILVGSPLIPPRPMDAGATRAADAKDLPRPAADPRLIPTSGTMPIPIDGRKVEAGLPAPPRPPATSATPSDSPRR